MSVVDTLSDIKRRVEEELQALDGSAALENLRVRVLGKKGELTALLKGMGKLAPEDIPVIRDSGNRTLAGPTAPPGGLYLTRVWYDDERLER